MQFAHAKYTAPQMCLRSIKAPEFTFNFDTDTKVSLLDDKYTCTGNVCKL